MIKLSDLDLFPSKEPNTCVYVQFLCWVVIEHLGSDAITGLASCGQKPSFDLIMFEEKAEGIQGHRAPGQPVGVYVMKAET